MSPFSFLKNILVTKSVPEQYESYAPYLLNRWFSFINVSVVETINTFNRQVFLEDKNIHFKLLSTIFPKVNKVPNVQYLKKVKHTKEIIDESKIKLLSEKYEISQREVNILLSQSDKLK